MKKCLIFASAIVLVSLVASVQGAISLGTDGYIESFLDDTGQITPIIGSPTSVLLPGSGDDHNNTILSYYLSGDSATFMTYLDQSHHADQSVVLSIVYSSFTLTTPTMFELNSTYTGNLPVADDNNGWIHWVSLINVDTETEYVLVDFDAMPETISLTGILPSGNYAYGFWMGFGDSNNDVQARGTNLLTLEPAACVPEPATVIIWSLLGGLGMVFAWRRRKAA